MKKKVTISEMDVQPISDEELEALTGTPAGAAAYLSQVCECTDMSNTIYCYDPNNQ